MIGNSFLGAVGGAGGGIPSMTTSSETGDLGVGANFGAVAKGDMNLNSSSSWKKYIVCGGLAVAFVVILATLKKKGVI